MSIFEADYFHSRLNQAKEFSLVYKIVHVVDSIVDKVSLGSSAEVYCQTFQLSQKTLNEVGFNELLIENFEEQVRVQ